MTFLEPPVSLMLNRSGGGWWPERGNPASLREKARFVKSQNLVGMMHWEYSHDPDEVLLDVLHRYLR